MKRKLKLKITPRIFGYAVFAVAALIFFLYLRFPGDVLIRHLAYTVSDRNPDLVLQIDSSKLVIPPGLTFTNVALGFRSPPTSVIQADAVTIRPNYLSLLSGRTTVVFSANAYGGMIQGHADTNHFLSFQGPINWKLTADGLDIGKVGYLKDTPGRQITGQFKGAMTINRPLPSFSGMSGDVEFTLINGSYTLPEPFMGFERLDFKSVEALARLKNGILTLSKLKLVGDRVNGVLSGTIIVDTTDINRSEINMNGAFELPPQNKKISMILTGTLANPRIRYM